MEGETTSKRAQNEIWRCLFDERVAKIGVHGRGGAGKTTIVEHINNRLLEEKDTFDKVIWVTVSKNSSIRTLQDKLAHKLEIDISRFDDEEARANELRRGFLKSKRYVLILDDLWQVEHDTFKKTGIPDPTPVNGCKLILTTRFPDICRTVNCDAEIVMDLLPEAEALELFLEMVGSDVSSNPNLKELVKEVARECARLPLAIITVAGALRKKTDPNEWEVALADLKVSSASISSEVMRNLRKSYDLLNDKKLKDCLLYCALYSEDYSIEKSLLVDQLIVDGIIKDAETRKYQVAKGHVMLKELVSVFLLIDSLTDEGDRSVKMHDLVRDMAIQIMRETSKQFLVKAGEELEFIPHEKYWNEDLEKVTLMGNNTVKISSSIDPANCPKVSTLFLNLNRRLKTIPSNFFSHMKMLSVLNLSRTGIRSLPESVSHLVNLEILLLEGCVDLIFVPSLVNLTNMKRLDMSSTAIGEVPEGLEMMIKLTHLNLSETRLRRIPYGTLRKLTNIQFLSFINIEKVTVGADEFSNLPDLESFEASLDFDSFKSILSSLEEKRGYINMRVQVLPEGSEYYSTKKNSVKVFEWKIQCDSAERGECGFPLLLPKNIETLHMYSCDIDGGNSLSQIFSLDDEASLAEVAMHGCDNMEYLFHYSPSVFPLLQRLKILKLRDMWDLLGLVFVERPPLSLGSFSSSLTHLEVTNCPKLKKLFNWGDPSLLNLETLYIWKCPELEEIVSLESDANAIITLPKLRQLRLGHLANIKSIPFEAEALREFHVELCPLIQEFHPIDREPYPPALESVNIDGYAWSSEHGMTSRRE